MCLSMKIEWKSWLAILGAVVIFFILVTLLVVYAYRANSEACQQGLLLQNENWLLQEKVRHKQENFLEMKAKWWSCSNVSITLNKNLEEVTSQRDLMHSELQKLKEENQNLAEKFRNTEAALQMEREKKNPEETSSALPDPQISSSLLGLGLAITWLL